MARGARPRAARRRDDRGGQPAVRGRPPARRRRQRRDRSRRAPRRARRPAAGRARRAQREPRPIAAWADALADAADALTATSRPRRLAARRARARARRRRRRGPRRGAERGPSSSPPRSAHCSPSASQGRPTRANFRTGHLTVCTLMPMRSVPHRVVCLLGMDDGVFPRAVAPRRRRPHARRPARRRPRSAHRGPPAAARRAAGGDGPADRHVRGQRRAHERRRGRPRSRSASSSTSSTRPCARPTARRTSASSCAIRSSPSTRGTSRRARSRASSRGASTRVTLDGARALASERDDIPPFLAAAARADRRDGRRARRPRPLRRAPRAGVPAAAARHLASATSPTRSTTRCPSSSTASSAGASGERLLDARPRPAPRSTPPIAAEIARGTLPPGRLARPVIERIRPVVEEIVAPCTAALGGDAAPESVDVRVALPDGRPLSGTVAGRPRRRARDGHLLARERAAPARRVGAAAGADAPRTPSGRSRPRRSGGADRGAPDTRERRRSRAIPPVGRAEALAHLADARRPLRPRHARAAAARVRASAAYARAASAGRDPAPPRARPGSRAGTSRARTPSSSTSSCSAGVRTFADLLEDGPRPDERGDGLGRDGARRASAGYARRLWDGLLACEEVGDQ